MIEYREKNKESLKIKTKEYKLSNPEKVKEWKKNWSKTEKGIEYNKIYQRTIRKNGKTKHIEEKYRNKNKEIIALRIESWRLKNLDKKSEYESKRRASKLSAKPSWYSEIDDFVAQEAHSLAKLREKLTGIKWHVDHVIPLRGKTVCGLHCWNNLQVITAKQNLQKGNFFERELS